MYHKKRAIPDGKQTREGMIIHPQLFYYERLLDLGATRYNLTWLEIMRASIHIITRKDQF